MKSGSVAVLLCVIGLAGCFPAPRLHPPVPPIPPEQVLAPPPSRTPLIWQPGHYDWTGVAYIWTPGAWVERAGHGTLWQDGFWQPGPSESTWIPGHWM